MTAGLKIAFVSSFPVIPPHGGNRARTLALMRALSDAGHDVHFIYLPSRQVSDASAAAHAGVFGAERTHWLQRGGFHDAVYYGRRALGMLWRKGLRTLGRPGGRYYGLDEIYFPAFSPQIRALDAVQAFDVAIVNYVFSSLALEAFGPSVLRVIDTHDTFTDHHKMMPADAATSSGYSITAAEEARGLARANIVLAIQDEEAAGFSRALGTTTRDVRTVGHIPDLSRQVAAPTAHATFLGSAFEANIVSLRWFLDQVLSHVVRQRPQFRLFIAGNIGDAIEDRPGVEKLGRVDHVADAFERGGISINPIVAGTGQNIKLLDGMAAGVPTVSTRMGVRGLDPGSSRGVIITDDGDALAFAEAVVRLVDDQTRRRALGALAREDACHWNVRQVGALHDALGTPRQRAQV